MKIYISGPISGTNDYMKRFEDAEIEIAISGHKAINPAEVNSHLPDDTTWEEYMLMSLAMLKMCDAIYMLKGWEKSKGANIEFESAIEDKMTIIFEK